MKLLNILLKYLQFASVKYPYNTLIMSSKLFYIYKLNQFADLILFYPRFKIKICLLTSKSNFKLRIYRPFHITSLQIPILLHKSENFSGSGLQMRAIILSLQISTPSAVLRFDSVVGRKPATAPLFKRYLNYRG